MRGRSLNEIAHLPVVLRGIELGRASDVLLDLDARRAVGLHVSCGDGSERFLPLAAAHVGDAEIAVDSALPLLEHAAAFYERHARSFGSLRGVAVSRGGDNVGDLADLLVGRDGALVAILVENGRTALIPYDDSISLGGSQRPTAATP